MVTVKEIFDLLASGELSNIKLSKTSTGALSEAEYVKVVGHLNLGVLELHKRFVLLKDELRLHACPANKRYYLRPERVSSIQNMNSRTYIEQTDYNRQAINIVKVIEIYNDIGEPLSMNDRIQIPYINEISFDTLDISKLKSNQIFDIVFQSFPDSIVVDEDFDPAEYNLNIPRNIIEPLLYYIAARTYKPMGTNESTVQADKSVSYQQQYELACQKIETYGLEAQYDESRTSFQDNGWV
jgi:hypothetical protein